MSKKQQQVSRPSSFGLSEMVQAQRYVHRQQWDEAEGLLQQIIARQPKNSQALYLLSEVYSETQNVSGSWDVADRLVQLEPDSPDAHLSRIAASVLGGQYFSSLYYIDRFLERWPDHSDAPRVRKTRQELQAAMASLVAEDDPLAKGSPEDLTAFERGQMLMQLGRLDEARREMQFAVRKMPDALPPLNNLSLINAMLGRLDEAIQMARQVLERDPENPHALGNLIQYWVRVGQRAEAEQFVPRLLALPVTQGAVWSKQFEALTFLGDDRAVIDLYTRFQDYHAQDLDRGLILHLVAVAYARQGDVKQAQQLWKQALRLNPGLGLVHENLDDLKKPAGERSGAWPFAFNQWVARTWIEKLLAVLQKNARDDKATEQAAKRLVDQEPALAAIIPILLERGDPPGREFALQLAIWAGLPIVRDFTVGPNGTDQDRMRAGQRATELGLLPRGKSVTIYVKGQQIETLLLNYGVGGDLEDSDLPRRVYSLVEQVDGPFHEGRYKQAERLLRKALEIAPDHPFLLSILVDTLELSGRAEEAEAVTRQIAEHYPETLFGQCARAELLLSDGRIAEAKQLLTPLQEREEFHYVEFAAFGKAYAQMLAAEGLAEGASSWLDIWSRFDPEHPQIDALRERLKGRKK